jgi:hypothetical protein
MGLQNLPDTISVGDIPDLERSPLDCPAVSPAKVVQYYGLIAVASQRFARMAADVASASGD